VVAGLSPRRAPGRPLSTQRPSAAVRATGTVVCLPTGGSRVASVHVPRRPKTIVRPCWRMPWCYPKVDWSTPVSNTSADRAPDLREMYNV